MSITARRQIAPVSRPRLEPERLGLKAFQDGAFEDGGFEEGGGTKLAWLGGIGALTGLGLAAGLYLAWQDPATRSSPVELRALLEPPRPEPATLAGMGRAMAALERDLSVWHRLVAPQGPLDLASLRAGLRGASTPPPAPAREPVAEEATATAWNPGRLVLVVLAVLLASVTLVAGVAALLLERTLLSPFRALRGAAAALVDGGLDQPIPGLGRDDEAGALARALERVRHLALAAQSERDAEPANLAEAGLQLEAAARRIECAAAAAAALALEATLDHAQTDASRVAQGVWDLSHQVVAIREATERALDAIGHLSQAAAAPASPHQPSAVRVLEEASPG